MSLDRLRRKYRATGAPLGLIYGPPGTGKTTAALSFPDAVLIPVEDGIPRTGADGKPLEVTAFEPPRDYREFLEYIDSIAGLAAEGEVKTLIIDSLDKLEPMLWKHVCQAENWRNIEEPGFGKGYIAAADEWANLIALLRDLNKAFNINVILIAHSDPVQFQPPGLEPYSRYQVRLHKRAAAVVQDECDFVGFLNFDTVIKKTEGGFGKANTHAEGGGTRILHVEDRPAYSAKNRFGMPAKVYVKPKQNVYPQIEQFFAPPEVAA